MQSKSHRALFVRSFTAVLLLLSISSSYFSGRITAEENEALRSKWIDLSLGLPLIELFNERAQDDDIARVEHISQLDLLRDVETGKKLVVFKSAEDAIRLLPHIHSEIDIIGYNLEHGPTNPINEQENPIEYIRRLREAVDEYDLELAFGPDRAFAISHASELAPYADYLILQIQKVQTEPETVYDFVLPILEEARLANPDIQTSVQIRTEGNVEELFAMLEPLQDEIDGISILTSEETLEVTEEIMGELRAIQVEPTRSPAEESPTIDVEIADNSEPVISENPMTATIVAVSSDEEQIQEQATEASTPDIVTENIEESDKGGIEETLSTPESNQRNGSTWLFVAIALVLGFALGAGYISYRTSS